MSVLEKNNLICEKAKPEFYKKLRLFYTTGNSLSIKSVQTREGQPVISVSRDGVEYRLGSAVRPTVEAQRWAAQFECSDEDRVIAVFGFAGGLYARELLGRMGRHTKLLIYEPSFEIFDYAMKNFDISDILADARAELIVEEVDSLAFHDALLLYMNYFNIELQQTAVLPQYAGLFPESLKRFHTRLRESDERIMVNKNTLVRFSRTSVENTLKNIFLLSNSNLAEEIGELVPRDVPVIIVSAGPSLDKNIEELKRARGKAFILAVDTAVKYLLAHNIMPDATITVEPEKPLGHYEDSRCDSIPLIFDIESNHEIVKRNKTRRFIFNSRGYIKALLSDFGIESTDTANGGSVATAAFALCYKLEFKRIILIGQDLSYQGSTTHAGGVESSGINADIGTVMIEGIDGGQVRTRSDWLAYLRWFENAISVMKDLKKDMEVIDATQGGALIHGTEVMTLCEAIERYCVTEYSFGRALETYAPMLTDMDFEKLLEKHRASIGQIKDIKNAAEKILPICRELCSELEEGKKDPSDSGVKQKAQEISRIRKYCESAAIFPLLNNYAVSRAAAQIQKLYTENDSLADYRRTLIAFEALRDGCGEIMNTMALKVLAIIPARSGSKSVKDKNIRMFCKKPMLAHSIDHAGQSKYINRIILSTDSEKYALIGQEYGAETPFIRPAGYAADDSPDIDVFEHCLKWLSENEHYVPDIVVQLRPTYPVRRGEDIDRMIELLLANPDADSVRSMARAEEIPYKMWRRGEDNRIHPIMTDIPECYNMPRQKLPEVFYQNACIDVVRAETITKKHSMTGDCILGYEMEHNLDIDTEEELRAAEIFADGGLREKLKNGGNRLVFDIDGVIAKLRSDNDYALAEPDAEMIETVNRLYDCGNTIILFTARGSMTGIDWEAITKKSLGEWGVKYHELKFGKPGADFYIDDRMLDMNILKGLAE